MAVAMGARTLTSASTSLVLPKSLSKGAASALLGHVKLWTSVKVGGSRAMCTNSSGVRRGGIARSAVSEVTASKIGAISTEGLPVKALMEVLDAAGHRGAEVSLFGRFCNLRIGDA